METLIHDSQEYKVVLPLFKAGSQKLELNHSYNTPGCIPKRLNQTAESSV